MGFRVVKDVEVFPASLQYGPKPEVFHEGTKKRPLTTADVPLVIRRADRKNFAYFVQTPQQVESAQQDDLSHGQVAQELRKSDAETTRRTAIVFFFIWNGWIGL